MKKLSKRKRTVIVFSLTMIIAGVVGGIAGGLSVEYQYFLLHIGGKISDLLKWIAFPLMIIVSIPVLIRALYIERSTSKQFQAINMDDQDDFDEMDAMSYRLDISSSILGFNQIFCMVCATVGFIKAEQYYTLFFVYIFLFLIFVLCAIFLQRKTIDLIQKINPEKRGDPLDKRFHKEWMNSCDELERTQVYRCGYEAFRKGQKYFAIALCIMMFSTIYDNISVLPPILLGSLWMQQMFTYLRTSIKLRERNKK